jgi:glutamate-5-semialdehyde dehydrogenase
MVATLVSILPQLKATHIASNKIRNCTAVQKNEFLVVLAQNLILNCESILEANKKDLEAMATVDPKRDRLLITPARLEALAASMHDVAQLPDPTGKLLLDTQLPNGLHLQKKAVALGVVGVIFEARPNVTLDVTALCIKAGNAVVLKGGTDAQYSNAILVKIIKDSLVQCQLPAEAVCLLPAGREYVQEMLTATKYIDIIIPRGSQGLIDFVRKNSLVPTIETGAGVCHTYVHSSAQLSKAAAIVVNAKTTRVSVCNALDTILVDKALAAAFLPMLLPDFKQFGVEVFADDEAYNILQKEGYAMLQRAEIEDFGREYLDFKCSVKVVENIDQALAHISEYSSRHSEAIVAQNDIAINNFLENVDAAAVFANASTRFTDGAEFGLGAEMGISTQKLHARGPFALEKLVTEKWIVTGTGQIR